MYWTDSIDQSQSHLCRNRTPVSIFCSNCQSAFFSWLVLFAIRLHCNRKEPVHRRHYNLFSIQKRIRIADHQRAEINIWNMLLLDWEFDEFGISSYMDHLVTKQVFAFDTEKYVTIADRNRDHHRRCLPGAESVFVDDDFETAAVIPQISRRVGRDENIGFCFDRRQKAIAFEVNALAALPRDAIIPFSVQE